MGDFLISGMILAIIFFILVNFIFNEVIAEETSTIRSCLTHDTPKWNQTFIYNEKCNFSGNNSTITRSVPYEGQVYVIWNASEAWFSGGQDWIASFPIGWLNFTYDTLHVYTDKFAAQSSLVFISLALPVVVEDLWFMWAINIPAYIFIGGGLYKLVLPFV